MSVEAAVLVRRAAHADCEQILALNAAWLAIGSRDEARPNGFLFGAPYTREDIACCIRHDAVVVAEAEGSLAGYYLLDDWSRNPTTDAYRDHLHRLRRSGVRAPARTACRAQVALSQHWHGRGLYRRMHDVLRQCASHRFDAAFSVVAKTNAKMSAHESLGWQVVGDDQSVYFVLLDLKLVAAPASAALQETF